MKTKLLFIPLISLMVLVTACANKDLEKVYVYEVNEVEVNQAGVSKDNLKNDLEFLSLVYSDLYGQTISENELNLMVLRQSPYWGYHCPKPPK